MFHTSLLLKTATKICFYNIILVVMKTVTFPTGKETGLSSIVDDFKAELLCQILFKLKGKEKKAYTKDTSVRLCFASLLTVFFLPFQCWYKKKKKEQACRSEEAE